MEQIGVVQKTELDFCYVLVNRVSACGENCAHCKGGCTPSKVVAKAKNECGAKSGDTVKITSDTNRVLYAAFVLYFLPIFAAILGAVVAYSLGSDTWITSLVAILLFFVPFLVIKQFEMRLVPTPAVTKIINSKKDGR